MSKKDKIDALVEDAKDIEGINLEDFRRELEEMGEEVIDFFFELMINDNKEE